MFAKGSTKKTSIINFSWKTLFSDWKAIAVTVVCFWSILTLFQIDKQSDIAEWRRIGGLPVNSSKREVWEKLQKLPHWDKMDKYEKEEVYKQMLEKV